MDLEGNRMLAFVTGSGQDKSLLMFSCKENKGRKQKKRAGKENSSFRSISGTYLCLSVLLTN